MTHLSLLKFQSTPKYIPSHVFQPLVNANAKEVVYEVASPEEICAAQQNFENDFIQQHTLVLNVKGDMQGRIVLAAPQGQFQYAVKLLGNGHILQCDAMIEQSEMVKVVGLLSLQIQDLSIDGKGIAGCGIRIEENRQLKLCNVKISNTGAQGLSVLPSHEVESHVSLVDVEFSGLGRRKKDLKSLHAVYVNHHNSSVIRILDSVVQFERVLIQNSSAKTAIHIANENTQKFALSGLQILNSAFVVGMILVGSGENRIDGLEVIRNRFGDPDQSTNVIIYFGNDAVQNEITTLKIFNPLYRDLTGLEQVYSCGNEEAVISVFDSTAQQGEAHLTVQYQEFVG